MGAGSLMFASSKDDIILVQPSNRQLTSFAQLRGAHANASERRMNATDRMLKYLAKLALPPPPKRLRAMAGMRPAVGSQLSEEKEKEISPAGMIPGKAREKRNTGSQNKNKKKSARRELEGLAKAAKGSIGELQRGRGERWKKKKEDHTR